MLIVVNRVYGDSSCMIFIALNGYYDIYTFLVTLISNYDIILDLNTVTKIENSQLLYRKEIYRSNYHRNMQRIVCRLNLHFEI